MNFCNGGEGNSKKNLRRVGLLETTIISCSAQTTTKVWKGATHSNVRYWEQQVYMIPNTMLHLCASANSTHDCSHLQPINLALNTKACARVKSFKVVTTISIIFANSSHRRYKSFLEFPQLRISFSMYWHNLRVNDSGFSNQTVGIFKLTVFHRRDFRDPVLNNNIN